MQYQRGTSLIELMISLALGVVLVLAATDVMLSGRQTYSAVTASSEIQDAAHYTLRQLGWQINHAGYTTDPVNSISKEFPADNAGGVSWSAGQVVAGLGNDNASQQLLIRLKGAGTDSEVALFDCQGQQMSSTDTVVVMRFYLDAASNSLKCASSQGGDAELVRGIRYLRLLFAVDSNRDGVVDQWLTPAGLAAATASERLAVTGVRVGMVVSSLNDITTATDYSFTLLEGASKVTYSQDRHQMQTIESTFWLANVALTQES